MRTNKLFQSLIIIAVLTTCLFGCTKENTKNEVVSSDAFCSVNIDCKDILDNLEDFTPEKIDILPKDGVILTDTEVEISDGDTVMSVTERVLKDKKIHIDVAKTPGFDTAYIRGIGNIYETDCGDMSGWSYKVNGQSPDIGADKYEVTPGDEIEWVYICNWDIE